MLHKWVFKKLSAKKRLELYPPLRALRIRVVHLSPDWRDVRIKLPLIPRTSNRGGGIFGGAIAALADPIAALAIGRNIPGHSIWTRSLNIDFIAEGRTDLELRFTLSEDTVNRIRSEITKRGRATPAFEYGFYDTSGKLCAKIHCRVAIRPAGYSTPS